MRKMKIPQMFRDGHTVFSLEVFPPKKGGGSADTIYATLDSLGDLKPDFISVTYGAGGSEATLLTAEIAKAIRERCGIEPLMHLTCISQTRDEMEETLKTLKEYRIENILALRGDIRPDVPRKEDFLYASDLVAFVRERGFSVSGGCYPEAHPEAESLEADLENLKKKVDSGAEHLVSQLFFDNNYFYNFADKARAKGINVPIEAGIMPVTNKNQIERMVTMCGASLPQKFVKMMQRYESKPEALLDAGIAYAVDQIIDLVSQGVDGIHLYTMNRPDIANRIYESVKKIIRD